MNIGDLIQTNLLQFLPVNFKIFVSQPSSGVKRCKNVKKRRYFWFFYGKQMKNKGYKKLGQPFENRDFEEKLLLKSKIQ